MNLDYLRTFLILSEVKSIQKAANILYLTPPAVKRILDNLEVQSGLTLFQRTHTGLEITESGTIFATYASQILDLYNEALSVAGSASDNERETIDAPWLSTQIKDPVFASAFSAFQAAHPEIDVLFRRVESLVGEHYDAINGYADIQHTHAVGHFLSQLPLCCAIAKDHPLATKDSIEIKDLAPYEILIPNSELVDRMDEQTRLFFKLEANKVQFTDLGFRESELFQWCAREQRTAVLIGDWTRGDSSVYIKTLLIEKASFENNCYTQKNPSKTTTTYVEFMQAFYANAITPEQ